jgi:uncharacterized protein with NRDE domain
VCTVAVAIHSDRRWPLVVAANRDERLGRPAEGWGLRDGASGIRLAAPRDLQAGGTWIGVSSQGVFAAVTNYRLPSDHYPDPRKRSRGDLVGLALAHPSAAAARQALGAVDTGRFNPFHFVVGDAASAFLWWYDGETFAFEELGPGLHVVTENSPHGQCPRGDSVRTRWPVDLEVGKLRELLCSHSAAPWSSACIHLDPHYGTRSAAVLRLAPSLGHSELYAAMGAPCTTPFEDRSALLAALGRSA